MSCPACSRWWIDCAFYLKRNHLADSDARKTPQTLRLDFKEGRGFEFTTAVEEVKARFDEDRGNARRAEAEALREFHHD